MIVASPPIPAVAIWCVDCARCQRRLGGTTGARRRPRHAMVKSLGCFSTGQFPRDSPARRRTFARPPTNPQARRTGRAQSGGGIVAERGISRKWMPRTRRRPRHPGQNSSSAQFPPMSPDAADLARRGERSNARHGGRRNLVRVVCRMGRWRETCLWLRWTTGPPGCRSSLSDPRLGPNIRPGISLVGPINVADCFASHLVTNRSVSCHNHRGNS
jgi:hypothetical protein